jgi:hypothetical protein
VKLFSLGFLTLFLELALIRYLAGNIWNLGYFPNLVLIAVFVGMGLGFTFHHLVTRASPLLFQASTFLLLGLVAFVYFAHPTVPGFGAWHGDTGGELYFTATPAAAVEQSFLPFVVCVLSIVVIFAAISQFTAKLFRQFRPLTAYTLDIAGSCAGILLFMLMSWLAIPAAVWFAVFVAGLLVPLAGAGWSRFVPLVPGLAIVLVAHQQDQQLLSNPDFRGAFEAFWSPYQKVEYTNDPGDPHRIYVNGVNHQHMQDPARIRESFYQRIWDDRARDAEQAPYRSVLIVGAGAGSDVTAALLNGAAHVDAVEIDPVIARLGERHNPHRAYQDPHVNLVVDDGRAFMVRTRRNYDLVVFALTDSLVKVSSMAQLRLENYLFTRESIERAYDLLNEGGDLVFYNYYRQAWLRMKIEELVRATTGAPPREVYRNGDFAVLAARKDPARAGGREARVAIPSDDWPFLYLKERGIPRTYAGAMLGMGVFVVGLIVLLHWTTRKSERYGGRGALALKLAFAFMGMAFLLLETKSVVQFSLLFGTTWVNNSLVFLAVLLLVLAANWIATWIADKRWLWWISTLLIASTLVTFLVPLRSLLEIESGLLRFVGASALTFSPIFFANLIFSITFRDQEVAEHLFGWNLIGTTIGGIAEYSSMLFGYAFLGVLVAACYTGVVLLLLGAGAMPAPAVFARAARAGGVRERVLRAAPVALGAVIVLFVGSVTLRAVRGGFAPAFDGEAPATSMAGVLEAESLRLVATSRPFSFWLQPTSDFQDGRWSKDGHMFASGTQPGDWVELELPALEPGPHRLELFLTKAGDYGIVAVSVNGARVGEPIDLSSYAVLATGAVDVGSIALRGRQDVLRLEVIGTSPSASPPYYQFGIDGVRLTQE